MHSSVVFTVTGTDRPGIVEEVTAVLLDLDANVETSRMARLGGEFAILMLVSLPDPHLADLGLAVDELTTRGYRVTMSETASGAGKLHDGWSPYRVEVQGADHEGIIHQIASGLSHRGITIESMDTETTRAPLSGTALFEMTALIAVPPGLADSDWLAELREAGRQADVDITVLPL